MKIKYIFLIIAALNLVSCDNYLDTTPDNRTSLDSPEKIKELLVNAYPSNSYGMLCFAMSDNAQDKGAGDIRQTNKDAYTWSKFSDVYQDSPAGYWVACFSAIANANQALEYIKTQTSEGNDKTIDPAYAAYYGEALLARAYAHFMLVNLWGKTYDPATAETDLGVPYVTTPEKTVLVQYERETVAEVYKKIEQDIKEGIAYINDNAYEVPKYHLNYDAAHTFISRFYLMKGDWEKVIEHASLALGSNPAIKLRDLNGAYTKMSLDEQEAQYNKADEPSVLLLASTTSSWYNYRFATVRYSMTNELQDKIFNTVKTGGQWAAASASYGSEHKLIWKWTNFFKKESLNATTGWHYVMTPLLSNEEALYNRAEAYAMLSRNDEAIADINSMLSKKIRNYNSADHDATVEKIAAEYKESEGNFKLNPFYNSTIKSRDILNCIIDLRRKEFYYEGHRWFDIRRFNMTVNHNIEGGTDIKLTEKDVRKQLQIPESAQAYGIAANPR